MKTAEERKEWRCPCRGDPCDEEGCNGRWKDYIAGGNDCRVMVRNYRLMDREEV